MQNNNFTNLWESVLRPNIHTAFEALTDADVTRINGNAHAFLQVLQARYSYTPAEAEVAMDTFMNRYNSFDNSRAGAVAATSPDHTVRKMF